MGELIGISKAARSIGVSSRVLCDRIYRAGIPATEGVVSVEDLKRVAPEIEREALHIEKTSSLRRNAHLHRSKASASLTKEDYANMLKRAESQLVMERQQREKYEAVFEQLLHELGHLLDSDDEKKRETALALSDWLSNELYS